MMNSNQSKYRRVPAAAGWLICALALALTAGCRTNEEAAPGAPVGSAQPALQGIAGAGMSASADAQAPMEPTGAPKPQLASLKASPSSSPADGSGPKLADRKSIPPLPQFKGLDFGPDADPAAFRAALQAAARDRDPDVARIAQGMIDDLDRLQRWQEQAANRAPVSAGVASGDSAAPDTPYLRGSAVTLPLAHLEQQVLNSADSAQRGEAIRMLARNVAPETVDLLYQARTDADPRNRRDVIMALGHGRNIGLDSDGRIDRFLRQAASDGDPLVADAAQHALDHSGGLEDALPAASDR